MTIREETEAIERQTLSRYATLSENSLGRRVPLGAGPYPALFPAGPGPHSALQGVPPLKAENAGLSVPGRRPLPHPPDPYAGGLSDRTHNFRALRLNEDLTEAIALGHDLGHTPFGHAGESAQPALPGRVLPLPPGACAWWIT